VIPSRLLIGIALGVAALALAASAWPSALPLWAAAIAILTLAAAIDAVLARKLVPPAVTRRIPATFPVSSWTSIRLDISWPGPRRLVARLFDHHPPRAGAEGLPTDVSVLPGGAATLTYRLRPHDRGEALFGKTEFRMRSPWRLWRRTWLAGSTSTGAVLPDFRPLTRYAILAVDNRTSQLGVRLRPRRGEGVELHHLREYRVGDSLRQIDWKATARRLSLISREYQDERNQQIVFLLDCGRTMRALEEGEPHFEHALRSVLLLTYVALRQGDAVGLLTFGGSDRWCSPVKGRGAMKTLLEAIHDLESSTRAPDYLSAAMRLIERQRRRALVVFISNLRDEDGSEIAAAARLLGRRHLVLVASLRETALDDAMEKSVVTFEEARNRAALHHYLSARRRAHGALRGRGLRFCDVAPRDLPVTLVNRYLDIKRTGAL